MHRRILKLLPVFILAGMMFTACGKSGEIKIDKTESGYFTESTEEAEKETEAVPETVEQQLILRCRLRTAV